MTTEVARAAVAVELLMQRRLTLPEIISTLPDFTESAVTEAYDFLHLEQFDTDRCCDVA